MPSQLERVQAFANDAAAVASLGDLDLMMREAASDFGADYYLMIHHANYFSGEIGLVNLGNYPREFREISLQDGTDRADPIMEACERTLTGFFWNDVGSVITMTRRHLERAAAVHATGLGDGFVVPAHIPGEHLGSCHFAVESGKTLQRDRSAALQTIATFGFEAARRLSKERDDIWRRPPPLTDRQRQCLILSARGKSDTVIAQLLRLSPKTVNEHIEEAKRRYGVATRGQLVVNALYASEISFQEIVDLPRRRTGRAACH
jgi:LuxR family transcriptional regulator, quorum-sensing system regulator CciR